MPDDGTNSRAIGNTTSSNIPMGMASGLVCQLLKKQDDQISLIVRNPIIHDTKMLPLVPRHDRSRNIPGLNLVVDTIAQDFKAVAINHNYDKTIKLNDPKTSEEGFGFGMIPWCVCTIPPPTNGRA